jgi:hypothetical protein
MYDLHNAFSISLLPKLELGSLHKLMRSVLAILTTASLQCAGLHLLFPIKSRNSYTQLMYQHTEYVNYIRANTT